MLVGDGVEVGGGVGLAVGLAVGDALDVGVGLESGATVLLGPEVTVLGGALLLQATRSAAAANSGARMTGQERFISATT